MPVQPADHHIIIIIIINGTALWNKAQRLSEPESRSRPNSNRNFTDKHICIEYTEPLSASLVLSFSLSLSSFYVYSLWDAHLSGVANYDINCTYILIAYIYIYIATDEWMQMSNALMIISVISMYCVCVHAAIIIAIMPLPSLTSPPPTITGLDFVLDCFGMNMLNFCDDLVNVLCVTAYMNRENETLLSVLFDCTCMIAWKSDRLCIFSLSHSLSLSFTHFLSCPVSFWCQLRTLIACLIVQCALCVTFGCMHVFE